MNDKEKLFEWIDLFNQGNLKGKELKEFYSLLEKNPRLRAEVRMDKELNDYLSEEDILELREIFLKIKKEQENSRNCDPSIFFLAASFFLLIGLVFSFFFYDISCPEKQKKNKNINQIITTSKDSSEIICLNNTHLFPESGKRRKPLKMTDRATGVNLLSERLLPDPALESLVGIAMRNNFFKMELPEYDAQFSRNERIFFKWKNSERKEISLFILNNTGNQELNFPDIQEDTISFHAGSLMPGLYYYKIIEDEDIVHFGKFIIKQP
ncbi:MAG: hypothetical protein Q8867_00075 [Bacteroidota bacterium]|nr:hypothetical protein [Bacteroidota bacterium]